MIVHWCGTGLSAIPGLKKLITDGNKVIVWNRTVSKAISALEGVQVTINEFNIDTLEHSLASGDIIVSMLPGDWHVPLAKLAISKKAQERKTGARGLRSIMEAVLLDTMFKIPSLDRVSKVIIDSAVIEGLSEPLLMYENIDQKEQSAVDE